MSIITRDYTSGILKLDKQLEISPEGGASAQLVLGGGSNTITISAAEPSSSIQINIPDTGGTDTLVTLDATQTLTAKTLTDPVIDFDSGLSGDGIETDLEVSASSGKLVSAAAAKAYADSVAGSSTLESLTDTTISNSGAPVANSFLIWDQGAGTWEDAAVGDHGDISSSYDGSSLSLTIDSGAIDNDNISASAAIAFTKLAALTRGSILIGDASNDASAVDAKTDGYILIGDGTDLNSVEVTGDVTIANDGTTTIGTDKVGADELDQTATLDLTNTTLSGGTLDDSVSGTAIITDTGLSGASDTKIASSLAIKTYVDTTAQGLIAKDAVRVATTANLNATYDNGTGGVGATLTNAGAQAAITIDGVALSVDDRVLVKDQTGDGEAELFDQECEADSGGSLNNKYFWIFTSQKSYYIWFNVNSGGSNPDPSAPSGAPSTTQGFEIAIATGASASTVASQVATIVDADDAWSASAFSQNVTFTAAVQEGIKDAEDGNTGWASVPTSITTEGKSDDYQNGIYKVTDIGSGSTNWVLTRATDFDDSPDGEVSDGDFVFIQQGTNNASTGWVQTCNCWEYDWGVMGETGISFTQFSGAGTYTGSNGVDITGTVASLDINSITNSGSSMGANDLLAFYDATTDTRTEKITLTNFVAELADGTNSGIGASSGDLSIDLDDLAAAEVDVSADSIAIIDSGDSSSKKESIADFVTAIAGTGIAASSGQLSIDISEVGAEAIDVSADSIIFLDADDNSTGLESVADLATGMAGTGLTASSGALSVDLDEVDAAAVDVANDSIVILDSDDNGDTKKESIADLASGMAGTGLAASSGQLTLSSAISGLSDVDTSGAADMSLLYFDTDTWKDSTDLYINHTAHALALLHDEASTSTTFVMGADASGSTDNFVIQTSLDGSAEVSTINFVSYTSSASEDAGQFIFQVDATPIVYFKDDGLDLAGGKFFKIGDTTVLTSTGLGSGVVSSSLTSVGTLTSLTTSGDISITGSGSDLIIQPASGYKAQKAVVYNSTSDANDTELFINGSDERFGVGTGEAVCFTVHVVGKGTDANGEYAMYKFMGAIVNNNGTTTLYNVVKEVIAESESGFDANIDETSSEANDALVVMVNGDGANTMKWTAAIDLGMTTYAS